jgi:anti-anti-sigma regulatory factor
VTIHFTGPQHLDAAAEARTRLLAAIGPDETVIVDLAGVTAADLGFVQVIAAARRQADITGARLRLAGPAPACIHDILARAGFPADDPDHSHFWTQGDLTS